MAGKIRNQRTMLQRNHIDRTSLRWRHEGWRNGPRVPESLETLLGIEGYAARLYFGEFAGMIKPGETDHGCRPRRIFLRLRRAEPPAAARSGECAVVARLQHAGQGFDHRLLCGWIRSLYGLLPSTAAWAPGLALDLMEPFRPLIADSAVLSAVNTRMVTERDFVRAGASVALYDLRDGRDSFGHTN